MLPSLRCGSCDCHVPSCLRLGPGSAVPRGWRVWESSSPPWPFVQMTCMTVVDRRTIWASRVLLGFLWLLYPRGRLATERWLCSQPTKLALWKQSFVIFTSWPQPWEGFGSPSVAQKVWMMRHRAEGSGCALGLVTWAGSTPWAWGEIKLSIDGERRANDKLQAGHFPYSISFNSLQTCMMSFLIPILQMWKLQLKEENYPCKQPSGIWTLGLFDSKTHGWLVFFLLATVYICELRLEWVGLGGSMAWWSPGKDAWPAPSVSELGGQFS